MAEILSLLFDHYTMGCYYRIAEKEDKLFRQKFEQLKEMIGPEEAVSMLDAVLAPEAVMEEVYFQIGVKVGIKLSAELGL